MSTLAATLARSAAHNKAPNKLWQFISQIRVDSSNGATQIYFPSVTATAGFQTKMRQEIVTQPDEFMRILVAILNMTPPRSDWDKPYVLVVDEAHDLKDLASANYAVSPVHHRYCFSFNFCLPLFLLSCKVLHGAHEPSDQSEQRGKENARDFNLIRFVFPRLASETRCCVFLDMDIKLMIPDI